MENKQQVGALHPNLLLLVTPQGLLIQLFTPIKGVVIEQSGTLQRGTTVWIEAIMQSKEHKIMYLVLGKWLPYFHINVIN
ncbi:hypothetical protein [Aquirufa aurantiipilula]|uniref:hypothetical protein n=1 Tax=Aquirufa aurantiipilula TaxID=2696561 RepID=UPI001CAA725F|nr:hypothetical protein [Aquirufa aurantiipilula]MBZ1326548.1 hypothetical protein [Aquirufa aurantiipilula]